MICIDGGTVALEKCTEMSCERPAVLRAQALAVAAPAADHP